MEKNRGNLMLINTCLILILLSRMAGALYPVLLIAALCLLIGVGGKYLYRQTRKSKKEEQHDAD